MKAKIIEIIGHGMEPERAECKADVIIDLFVEKLKVAYYDVWHDGTGGKYNTFDKNDYLYNYLP